MAMLDATPDRNKKRSGVKSRGCDFDIELTPTPLKLGAELDEERTV